MKIALLIERFDPQGGGAERSAAQIAHELSKAGHDVTILAGTADTQSTAVKEAQQAARYAVTSLGIKGRFGALKLFRFSKWARKQLSQGNFDASLSFTTTVPASVVQPRSGTLKETFARNIAMRPSSISRAIKRLTLLLSIKHQLLLSLERRTLRDPLVKRFAAVSEYVKTQLVRHYRIDPQRIAIIPNAAAMPSLTPQERQTWRKQIREGFSIKPDTLVYVFAALNPRLKGANTLIRATAILRERGLENFIVLMAGQMGYSQQHLAAKLDVRDQIRFVGATSHMDRLYCASDVTVLPSFYDPSSKVVIESLMMGVPAISTSFNGASDMILPGGGITRGRVIDNPADQDALADAMEQLADPASRSQCAAMTKGLSHAFSMQVHVQKLMMLFEEVKTTSKPS